MPVYVAEKIMVLALLVCHGLLLQEHACSIKLESHFLYGL
jgi:hypothetical protein